MRFSTALISIALLAGAAHGQDIGVFATSSLYQGASLGGVAGADALCDELGTTAMPGSGPWKAWLSVAGFGVPSINASDRIDEPGGVYVRAAAPGTVVADDLADLTNGDLDNAILLDEAGNEAPGPVWTGTMAGGTPNGDDCGAWASGDLLLFGHQGETGAADSDWTDLAGDRCGSGARLYCFGPLAPLGAADTDGDGVGDTLDVCAETFLPEGVPTRRLRVNRFALVDDDGVFDTRAPNGRGPEKGFTIEDTAGCSCEQIILALELGKGHTKFGCSLSAMEAWAALVSP